MKGSSLIVILSTLIALLGIFAAGSGLFSRRGGESFSFTTLYDQQVRMYGQGLYRNDTLFFGAGFKGQDAAVLFLGVPLLVISTLLYRQGSITGQLLLAGSLGYFLYVYASMALGAAYNRLFLVYIVLFSTSLYAFIQVFSSVDLAAIASRIPSGLPVRGLAIFLIVSGLITIFVWGSPLVSAFLNGSPPDRMDSYTTMVTYALDLAIITPATILCAVLVLQGNPLGYVIAVPLLTLLVLLAPQIILGTIFQRSAGVPFTPAEIVGPVAGFVILGITACWLLFDIFQALSGSA
jgi:hypothetical protein